MENKTNIQEVQSSIDLAENQNETITVSNDLNYKYYVFLGDNSPVNNILLDAVKVKNPDCTILSYFSPEMSPKEAANIYREIRESDYMPDSQFILMPNVKEVEFYANLVDYSGVLSTWDYSKYQNENKNLLTFQNFIASRKL